MRRHQTFRFSSKEELLEKAQNLGLRLPFQEDVTPLLKPFPLAGKWVPNRMAVHPMEGFDAAPDGSPSELTLRRYLRFAGGGSGVIWFEAASVCPEGRSNPRQLYLHEGNRAAFKALVERTRREARIRFGKDHDIFCILQLTHSGRYSKPEGRPAPLAAAPNPVLDKAFESVSVISDAELERTAGDFLRAALQAGEAGFDGVDIKACHGYLVNDLLSARSRTGSYGGGFSARTRFIKEVLEAIRRECPGLTATIRLSAGDGLAFPHGFGTPSKGGEGPDLTEPKALIAGLIPLGLRILNVSLGVPYVNPHWGRPFDRPVTGAPLPREHPLEGVARLIETAAEIQKAFPELPVAGTGYSWLRQYWPRVAAAVLSGGAASLIGLGRSSIAYPDAPRDLMEKGGLDRRKVCTSCSWCTELMRAGRVTGCVVRDREIYAAEFLRLRRKRASQDRGSGL